MHQHQQNSQPQGRLLKFFFTLLVLLGVFALPLRSLAAEPTVVRVAFPVQEGLTSFDRNGNPTGYTYDYLNEIARYTGWKYEFITPQGDLNQQLVTLQAMLDAGEVDVMGGMVYNEFLSSQYDYATVSYGSTAVALYALNENSDLTSLNYTLLPTLRVAVPENAPVNRATLAEYARINRLSITEVPVPNGESMEEVLRQGRADVVLRMDIGSALTDLRLIVRLSEKPFYFAIARGHTEVVRGINAALARISEVNPEFPVELRRKYFATGESRFYLSTQESQYIAQTGSIKVLLQSGLAPLHYRDQAGSIRGVTPDLLHYITQKSGLSFELTMTESSEEFERLVLSGEYPIVAGISNFATLPAEGMRLSLPYLSAPTFLLLTKDITPTMLNGKRVGIIYPMSYTGDYVGTPVYCDSLEGCLRAIKEGQADYCYANSYSAGYYLNEPDYRNLTALAQSEEWAQSYHLGLSVLADHPLYTIINKAIAGMPENLVRESLFSNSYQPPKITFMGYLQANPWQAALISVVLFLTFALFFLISRRHRDREREKRKRAELLERAQRDSLTEAYNAGTSHQRIAQSMDKGAGVLFVLDVDRFKQINDQFGHFIGDQTLRGVADALRSTFGNQNIVGRLGGDEFVVFVQGFMDNETIDEKVIQIRRSLEVISLPGRPERLSVSIGVAHTAPGDLFDLLYQKADKALYAAKAKGRDGYQIAN